MPVSTQSALLADAGFSHAFSYRTGGVSAGAYATLNLARAVGDDGAAVEENLRRFLATVPCETLYEVTQVHGDDIHDVEVGESVPFVRSVNADALVARAKGLAIGVRTADCVPILLADPETGAVAAVHAGWRGCVARILPKAIARLGGSTRLLAAVGAHIRVTAFEIGEEVATEIEPLAQGAVVRGAGKPHADLTRVIVHQLETSGVAPERIDVLPGCTFAEPELYHSYRRDGARSGRHLAVIVAR